VSQARRVAESNFNFLRKEWPELSDSATKAESLALFDPRTSCFYTRRALELAVLWMYKYDAALKLPYSESLSARIFEPTFRQAVGSALLTKIRVVKDLGNLAVHDHKPMRDVDAIAAMRELFHFCFWLARTYARGDKPPDTLQFNPDQLSKVPAVHKQTQQALLELESKLHERDEKLTALLADKATLDEQLKRLRAEVAEAKQANVATPDTHDYSEAQTRDYFIDLLLKEAGWTFSQPGHDSELRVEGMPNEEKVGFVDYVLWGDDGKPLGLVEAKRTKRDARAGQQQAKLYADCLEKQFDQRPIIFYSNGYQHWLWDDTNYPPRAVLGFYKRSELELLIQRRKSRKPLADAKIDNKIVERYYQTRAIRRISEAFERDHDRKALVVMATGAGKTRTVIALCELLMRCNWIKRVLFLADRVALVRQAVNAFKTHLPDSSPVNLVTEKEKDGRVFVSTYPTMMGLIDEMQTGQRRFGVGHFDLVIIDEAHRSVYQKYRAIFEYFDSLLVGLTATPKDEIDRNTYSLFELETGVPTDAYDLQSAVDDGFLVPPKAVSVPLKFQREGIKYDQLAEDEKEQWDALDWNEEGEIPDRVEAEAVNKWLFNKDTVDKVLAHVMTRGVSVAGGDRLAKTIVFAKNHDHAQFIAERFDANYPHYKGEFARVIDFQVDYAQTLIDNFSNPARSPHIALSVDMLDTGIDIPEIANLVFFKLVRSKTKFWQMVGRGTRLRPDLFGPGKAKKFFYIFDYCQNLEFFSQNPETTEGALGEALGTRLFKARLDVIAELDKRAVEKLPVVREDEPASEEKLRDEIAAMLRDEVAAMNVDNFVVRPKRGLVERFAKPDAWTKLKPNDFTELASEIAGLPSELDPEDEEAKRFDLLILNIQLAVLRAEPHFNRLRDQVRTIASLLEENSRIPAIQQRLALIQDIQTEEWWENVTVGLLENTRKALRQLVKLIEKKRRKPVYSDFEDQIGAEATIELPGVTTSGYSENFRAKALQFLRQNENHIAIHKLRMNQPLTATDLDELEKIFLENGVGTESEIENAKSDSGGLGLFVRSLVGLDREAAKSAFADFLSGKKLRADQIEFVNLIIDHVTQSGSVSVAMLYESPYTDINPKGVDGVFASAEVEQLASVLDDIRRRAAA
jgi:type I restriction enzyme, R subunit